MGLTVRDWLDGLKKGWGEKFGPAFDEVGMEVSVRVDQCERSSSHAHAARVCVPRDLPAAAATTTTPVTLATSSTAGNQSLSHHHPPPGLAPAPPSLVHQDVTDFTDFDDDTSAELETVREEKSELRP